MELTIGRRSSRGKALRFGTAATLARDPYRCCPPVSHFPCEPMPGLRAYLSADSRISQPKDAQDDAASSRQIMGISFRGDVCSG